MYTKKLVKKKVIFYKEQFIVHWARGSAVSNVWGLGSGDPRESDTVTAAQVPSWQVYCGSKPGVMRRKKKQLFLLTKKLSIK